MNRRCSRCARLGVDDVVVEVIRAVARSDGEQLGPGEWTRTRAQAADFRRDVDGHGAEANRAGAARSASCVHGARSRACEL